MRSLSRRQLLGGAFAAASLGSLAAQTPPAGSRRVALTIDDGPVVGDGGDMARYQKTLSGLIAQFKAENVPIIMFVNERNLQVNGQRDARVEGLRQWLDAGFDLGNHTYSHPNINNMPLWQFEDDLVRGEVVTRALLAERSKKLIWFRHPYLRTGANSDIAKGLQDFLDTRGYRVAPITVDYADYSFASVYSRLLRSGDETTAKKVYDALMDAVDVGFGEAEKLSMDIFGREIAQTLLIHSNELESVSLHDGIGRMRKRGYTFITLDEALKDAAYQRPDGHVGTSGITWLRRWLADDGKPLPPELGLPKWIQDLPRPPQTPRKKQ